MADLIESGRTTYSLVVCRFDLHFFSNKDIFFSVKYPKRNFLLFYLTDSTF